ncbi:MAG: purine-nucleoside phosphorylase [Candidatus Neoclostridium sp.]
MSVPTPHINAKKGDFAKTVLMPGDPLRSAFIAQNFLENPVLVNNLRGVQGYTGYYKGRRVSVMASGMGQPSIGIYSFELFNFYDVDNIIRVGSCGSFDKDLHVRDIILAMGACTNGNYAAQYKLPGTFCPIADFGLLKKAADACENKKLNYKVGNVLSSDTFYDDGESGMGWTKMGVLGVEMEAAALYMNALRAGKKALAVLSVSDSFVYENENLSGEQRERSFVDMIEVALELI